MKCANCGAEIDAATGRCMVCGAEVSAGDTGNIPNINREMYGAAPPRNTYYEPLTNQPVSVARWIGRMFITWIPVVGSLVYLIMLIVWACSDKFEATSKNWALASLIMTIIRIIVGIAVFYGIFALLAAVFSDPGVQQDFQTFMQTLPIY